MIERPSGPTQPGPSTRTASGARIDSAKYSAGWWLPMPVRSGPRCSSAAVDGSLATRWHDWQPRSKNACRPAMASPAGTVNRQVGGTPPVRCSSIMLIRTPGLLAGHPGFQPRTAMPLPHPELPGFLSREQLARHHAEYVHAVEALRQAEQALGQAVDARRYGELRRQQVAAGNSVLLHELYFG